MSAVGCSLQEIISRKDSLVRVLESRSYKLLYFTYESGESKEKSEEHNNTLEEQLERLILAAHQELALYRIQSNHESNNNTKLQHLHSVATELDGTHTRFLHAKNNLPNDKTKIITIFGADDLQAKANRTTQGLSNLNKALEGSKAKARELSERNVLLNNKLTKLNQVQQKLVKRFTLIVNLINQFSYNSNSSKNETAEKILDECLFRIASEFKWQDWSDRINKVNTSLDVVKPVTEVKTPLFGTEDRDKFIYDTLANHTVYLKSLVSRSDALLKMVDKLLSSLEF